ncbi:MAG: hypothetical protein C0501_19320 [Isosphaera sp.]|nr:hypothetical protein [Isosphaera sp.]
MPITLNCGCGRTLRVRAEHAGRRLKCPGCGARHRAPKPGSLDELEVVEDEPATPGTAPLKVATAVDLPPVPAQKPKKRKKAADGPPDRRRAARVVRGAAVGAAGLVILAFVAAAFVFYAPELREAGGEAVGGMVLLGVLGLLAVGSGALRLGADD